MLVRPEFIRPISPSSAIRPPQGDEWLHEPKLDGYRFQVVKNGRQVRLFSKSGAEYSSRLPAMVEAFAELPARAVVVDGELVLLNVDGTANFRELMVEMRKGAPDEARLIFYAFDLLHQDGIDLTGLPLLEHKRDLARLCRKAKVPFLKLVETFPDGQVLFDYACKYGFEGIVSKRLSSRYSSGPSRNWVKVKSPNWKRINANRWRIFEDNTKPAMTKEQKTLKKKREELARVMERLASPNLSPGIARELRKQVTILEREIAELEQG